MRMISKVLKICRIPLLGLFLLHFFLGSLLARNAGFELEISLFLLNLEWLVALYLGFCFLNEYVLWLRDESEIILEQKGDFTPQMCLTIAFVLIAFSIILLYFQYQTQSLQIIFFIQLLIIFLGFIFLLPPLRLTETPIGELILSILVSVFTVFYGYFVGVNEIQATLYVISFAFLFQLLAFLIIHDLENYTEIVKYEKKTLLGILGWEQGFYYYASFSFISYFILGFGIFLGLLSSNYYFVLIGVGFLLLQIFNLRQIQNGEKPHWRFTKLLSYLVYFLPIYSIFIIVLFL